MTSANCQDAEAAVLADFKPKIDNTGICVLRSKAGFEATQQALVTRSTAFGAEVASLLEQALNEFGAVAAAFPNMVHTREQIQRPDSSTALGMLRQGYVLPTSCRSALLEEVFMAPTVGVFVYGGACRTSTMGQEELGAALETLGMALHVRFGDMREALSLALQKQLLLADSASQAKKASERLNLLTQAHQVCICSGV